MASTIQNQKDQIRLLAEADLESFIRLIAPHRVLGGVHQELIEWWQREDRKHNQLVLLPRDHGKSAMVAYRVAWTIARRPDVRILYLSSTSGLAEKQLKAVKDILTSDIFMDYWPYHINPEEGKREKWTNSEIAIDHPKRRAEAIRDATVFTGGLTTSLTGFHCDIVVLDDVVVYENAYTNEGREKVKTQYSLAQSIAAGEYEEWVVGTRYHPNDLYGEMQAMEVEVFDQEGNIIDRQPVYEIFERQVEDRGDGTGKFLWPRQRRTDGRWFGFDSKILAEKRAKYLDRTQFRAQYYNDPNDISNSAINRSKFQYYDKKFLKRTDGHWEIAGNRLNVYAAIDFAFSLGKRSDYTAVVVIGIDARGQTYILDISRLKTDKISEYYGLVRDLHVKWDFRKLRAEVTVAQAAIVKELKSQYITPNGLYLSIDEHHPSRHQGSKEERIAAILEPRYTNLSVWHYRGGDCQELEDELVLQHPPHDDIKDALAAVIEIAVPPVSLGAGARKTNVLTFNPRFGGVAL